MEIPLIFGRNLGYPPLILRWLPQKSYANVNRVSKLIDHETISKLIDQETMTWNKTSKELFIPLKAEAILSIPLSETRHLDVI